MRFELLFTPFELLKSIVLNMFATDRFVKASNSNPSNVNMSMQW